MPSTPLLSSSSLPDEVPQQAGRHPEGPTDSAPDHGAVSGVSDTERPPSVQEGTRVGPPPVPARASKSALRAASEAGRGSSAKLAAAQPKAPNGAVDAPPTAKSATKEEPAPLAPVPRHVATMLGGGLAPAVELALASGDVRASMPSFGDVPLTRRCTSCSALYPTDFLVCPRDATPLADIATGEAVDPLVGKLLGETYQIVRVVGEGGMGRIYEARHLRLKERRFAVKTLHADLARNAEMAARFLREAEAASSLHHPNVIDVFDVHHLADGTPYFVGEFLEGEELAGYVARQGALDPRMAAVVGRQVCGALAAAHARGIIHRDMKPENIFVLASSISAVASGEAKNLTVKVLDFGISKAGSGADHLTRTGVIMGTPSYMSPEQARGRPVDHRADVYSVGAVLYFAVTGRRPFDSDDPTSTLSMVLTQDPVRPREIDPRIPESLELVIQKAMAKEARDRYPTMSDLEKALAAFLAELAGGAPHVTGAGAPASAPRLPERGAQRALTVARAMLNPPMPAPMQNATLAQTARPTIVLTSAALGAWLVGGTTAALAGLVRWLHEGEITVTESVLLVVGCLFASATPIALYVLHVKKVIWPNTVRSLQLATDLKRTASAALVTYGALCVATRIVMTVFVRSSQSLGSGLWDILLFAASVLAAVLLGGAGPLVRNLRRRRTS